MLISEAKKGIKCFVQGYGEEPDRFYIETFGVIAETPSPNSPLADVIIFGDEEKRRIRVNVEKLYWIDQSLKIPGYTEEWYPYIFPDYALYTFQRKLPEIIAADYLNNKFEDFFKRVLADIDCTGCCGLYEKEIAEALLQAFKDGREI